MNLRTQITALISRLRGDGISKKDKERLRGEAYSLPLEARDNAVDENEKAQVRTIKENIRVLKDNPDGGAWPKSRFITPGQYNKETNGVHPKDVQVKTPSSTPQMKGPSGKFPGQ